jgi:hypothetical protein
LCANAPRILTPIKLKTLDKYLYAINITIQLNIAPDMLYIKLETLPVISIRSTLFSIETIIPSLNPKTTNVTNITIFDRPNLAPGIAMGKGIADSKTLKASPIATNKDIKIILFSLFMPYLFLVIHNVNLCIFF